MISNAEYPWQAGLFGDQEVQDHWSHATQIGHFVAFEIALAHALEDHGQVAEGLGAKADHALTGFAVDHDALRVAVARDGVPIPELVRQMRAVAGNAGPAIHTGATSHDVMDTALALTLQAVTDTLLRRIETLTDALETLNPQFGHQKIMGRTRMQAALPITVSDRLAPIRNALKTH